MTSYTIYWRRGGWWNWMRGMTTPFSELAATLLAHGATDVRAIKPW